MPCRSAAFFRSIPIQGLPPGPSWPGAFWYSTWSTTRCSMRWSCAVTVMTLSPPARSTTPLPSEVIASPFAETSVLTVIRADSASAVLS